MARLTSGVISALLLLTGCSGSFPADPDGTLDRVSGDVLRAGVTANPPWTEVEPGAPPSGTEVELVTEFAESVGARVEWTNGSEEDLVGRMGDAELDVLVGGFTGASPWTDQVAMTTPYTTVPDEHGAPEGHVMAVPLGENAMLVRLETFLLTEHRDVLP
jgi:hypothetical protein